MNTILQRPRWSPYAVGAGLGVLSWATFAFMGKALGTSTTMVRAAGMLEGCVAPQHVQENAYFAKYLVGKPGLEWQFALVVALGLGAFVAARMGKTLQVRRVPELWARRFGPSRTRRYFAAFLGGGILLFGARLAGGCTSGHGISGGLQLAVSSWVFVLTTFTAGIATASLLFRGARGESN